MQLTEHNGILDTEKIFEKIELMISMGSLTFNLVIASKIKWKKWKKKSWKWWDLNHWLSLKEEKMAYFANKRFEETW